ncbi:ABC transporter permease [Cohaesibacter celericrescens]|uniref:ABC transporter permease n=1 Tax=Cohaesibacter celericrescens TaxID=2067669 RepID=A0A2N5XWG6_9HYPH|nr:ABC transporter permease [Cohaesibacter celericrescens]PLW78765.1 ABC transporter permease [Cohaesibacter celericrescens]
MGFVKNLNQERIVFAITIAIFALASLALPGFFSANNLVSVVRSVSVLGILALGMSVIIIGRGIDLSMVSIMAMSVACYLQMLGSGVSEGGALAFALAGVICIGLINGFLVAYAEVPAIFVTLASASFVFGFVRSQLISTDSVPVPAGHWVEILGSLRFGDVPIEVFIFAGLSFAAFLFLRYSKWGRYVYYAGDNPEAARNAGMPVRPMMVLRYVLSALVAFIAGILTAASLHSINTRIVNSSLLYDIVLVAVIGGIGLSGGKGGVRNVLFGAALIGIMLNAMTIIDISLLYQNLIKSAILLGAIIVDGLLNPRDEQTAQQGDI